MSGHVHKGFDAGEQFPAPAAPGGKLPAGVPYPIGMGVDFVRDGPNGAVAYIGCTVGAQGSDRHLMDGFIENYLSLSEPRLGDVWSGAVSYYHRVWGLKDIQPKAWGTVTVFIQGMTFHLFGDPSMRLPRSPNRASNLVVNGSFEIGPEVGDFLPQDEGSTRDRWVDGDPRPGS